MPSFGEADIRVGGRHVGRISVVGMRPAKALFPRLQIDAAILLQDSPSEEFEPGRPVKSFELTDCRGELFLPNDVLVASVHVGGSPRVARSAGYPAHNSLTLHCDLDAKRIRRLEEARGPGPAEFRLFVWATLQDKSGPLDATVEALRLTVPRDDWLVVMGAFEATRYELIEVPYPGLDESLFESAAGHLRDAIARVAKGDYDEALAACRRAIEGVARSLDIDHDVKGLQQALEPRTDSKRAEAIAVIVSKLKQLANITVHRSHPEGKYSRVEAQFVVGCTAHAIALMAKLGRPSMPDAG